MKIVCDNCTTKYSIADEKVRGKVFKIKCKKCSHIIVVKGEPTTGEGHPAGFDQKETRVFDYSGFEGQRGAQASASGAASAPAAASAAASEAAADPIWHLVIDREQVGPLTLGELEAKWDSGEIDGNTYAWREGFGDWQRLAAIDELAHVAGRASKAAGADTADTAGMFGTATSTPAAGSPHPTRADPTDLFAGAGSSTEDETSSELFGGGGGGDRAAAASSPASIFSSSSGPTSPRRSGVSQAAKEDLFGSGIAEPVQRADVRPMTAQRNENSVLFSLNNLSALAAGEPSAPRASSGGGGGGLGSFGASTTGDRGAEGSGLIDIRAMAQMTLGAAKRDEGPRPSRASEDDLPVFSASSFSAPAAGVLLPTVQPSSNRLVYVFMGVVGLLALAAIVLVAVILLGKKDPAAALAEDPAALATSDPARTETPPPSSATPPASRPPSSATPPAATPPSTAAPAATPPSRTEEKPPASTPPPRPTETRRPTTAPRPTAEPSRPTETRPTPAPPVEAAPRPSEPAPRPATQKCDEVACLVTPDLPCCPKRGSSSRPSSGGDSSLPDRLEQADIIAGMKAVNGRVMACNDRTRVPGTFKVKVTVGADGSVNSATAGPPVQGTAAESCVESAVKGARFKRTKNSITFNYPYTFR